MIVAATHARLERTRCARQLCRSNRPIIAYTKPRRTERRRRVVCQREIERSIRSSRPLVIVPSPPVDLSRPGPFFDRLIKPGFRLRLPLERPIKALHQNARFFSFPPPSVREPRDRWPPDVRHPGTIYIDDKFLPSFHQWPRTPDLRLSPAPLYFSAPFQSCSQ